MASDLTNRQTEIKALLDNGKQAREIANELGISRNAVYQHIQRLRRDGRIDRNFTPTGQAPRELLPGADLLRSLVQPNGSPSDEAALAGSLALVNELRRTRDELDVITRRISALIPR